mmetsp:Transcript_19707/g.54135  ORF Transcript_19707/g.54135 Transcript_19707/m.54135 type:complete len:212 (-) Transcript_19707:754-1389(-)
MTRRGLPCTWRSGASGRAASVTSSLNCRCSDTTPNPLSNSASTSCLVSVSRSSSLRVVVCMRTNISPVGESLAIATRQTPDLTPRCRSKTGNEEPLTQSRMAPHRRFIGAGTCGKSSHRASSWTPFCRARSTKPTSTSPPSARPMVNSHLLRYPSMPSIGVAMISSRGQPQPCGALAPMIHSGVVHGGASRCSSSQRLRTCFVNARTALLM